MLMSFLKMRSIRKQHSISTRDRKCISLGVKCNNQLNRGCMNLLGSIRSQKLIKKIRQWNLRSRLAFPVEPYRGDATWTRRMS
jgi:hypothetical protein